MENTVARAIARLPMLLRPGVELWFERLAEQGDVLPAKSVESVARLVACSEFAARTILREFPWVIENDASLSGIPKAAELDRFVDEIATSDDSVAVVKSRMRRYRNRHLLHVLWREVDSQADLDETLYQLSHLADRLLEAATGYAERQLRPRFGQARNPEGDVIPLVVLGMGKLGGGELNFSSDIDIIFCYSEDGESDGEKTLSAQEYFTRLSRQMIALLDEVTVDGFVFRIDTRLRPFGDSGPPVVSFAALESYLLQHGRDWERYAYVKAKIVGARPCSRVADELQNNLIRPFVYRRYIDYGVFESVRNMQEMIATDVRRLELADNIKLGPGGIREAEFIVQAMQLVRGGSEPALQCRELQTVLPRLVSERGLGNAAAEEIRAAYRFLRRVENFIQAIRDEQTHDLPRSEIDRERLCMAMGYANWDELVDNLDRNRNLISAQFELVAFRGRSDKSSRQQVYRQLLESNASQSSWANELRDLTGADATGLAREIVTFATSSATQQVDTVSRQRLRTFLPKLVELVTTSENALSALTRTLAVTERILRRSAYLALLNENQQALSRLVDLCARSQYIANQIARYPVLLDELLDPGIYSDGLTKNDLAAELQQKLGVDANIDSEGRMLVIAQFQRAAMFRIAVADFNDKLTIMKVSDALTWLAEVVLDEALCVAWSDTTARYGVPHYVVDGVSHEAGFGIIGYGKLGGLELSYGSDLDIVFLHDSKGEKQVTDADKPLENSMFFGRLVRRLVHFLTTQTGSGELYEVDTRLRPDGRSGLLVTNAEAFERYQEENAWTWEHQALLRARAVAGSGEIAKEFERIRRETLVERVHRDKLRDDVIAMRQKMRTELDRSNETHFDLKHGRGGIGDIEFLVQYLVLGEADSHADVIIYSDNIRQLDALIASEILEKDSGERLQEIYKKYRLYVHRRVLDGQKAMCEVKLFYEEREFVMSVWRNFLDNGA
jgi:glutamate-ammonia-ligase adenylyltransferase